jgi:hypothetical protein
MWPFTARVNEKTAPIERIAAGAIKSMSALPRKRTLTARGGMSALCQ